MDQLLYSLLWRQNGQFLFSSSFIKSFQANLLGIYSLEFKKSNVECHVFVCDYAEF